MRATRDAWIAAAIVLAGGAVFITRDSAEHVTSALRTWEHLEIDDVLLTACLAVAASSWFAWRRWRDALRELQARRQSELQNERYVGRLEQLSGQLLETEQQTRSRFATLLHDEVGQTLYASRLQLEQLAACASEPTLRDGLERAQELVDDALERTRDLTHELTPPILHDLGLCEALEWLADKTRERAALEVRVASGDAWRRIPSAWHEPLFQSVRELVVNAVKHARATRVDVTASVSGDGCVRVCVRDDGQGFEYVPTARRGFGLFSTERRMAWLGAAMRVESGHGAGTAITLEFPEQLRM